MTRSPKIADFQDARALPVKARPLVKTSLHVVAEFIRERLGAEHVRYLLLFHCKLSTLFDPDQVKALGDRDFRVPYRDSVGLAVCRRTKIGKIPLFVLDIVNEVTPQKRRILDRIGIPYLEIQPGEVPKCCIDQTLQKYGNEDPSWVKMARQPITPSESTIYTHLTEVLPKIGAVYLPEVSLMDVLCVDQKAETYIRQRAEDVVVHTPHR